MRFPTLPALLLAASSAAQAQLSDPLLNAGFEDREQHLDHGLLLQPLPNSWSAVFGATFPAPNGNFRSVRIESGRYVSIQLTGPGSVAPLQALRGGAMRIETSEAPGATGAPVAMSISTLRGDFRSVPGPCLAYNGTVQVSIFLAQCPASFLQTYWLNIANIALPYAVPAQPLCPDPQGCSSLLGVRN